MSIPATILMCLSRPWQICVHIHNPYIVNGYSVKLSMPAWSHLVKARQFARAIFKGVIIIFYIASNAISSRIYMFPYYYINIFFIIWLETPIQIHIQNNLYSLTVMWFLKKTFFYSFLVTMVKTININTTYHFLF